MENIQKVLLAYGLDPQRAQYRPYGSGHINDTYLVTEEKKRYILQRINTRVFKDVEGLMRNIALVTGFLREKVLARGGDVLREMLTLLPGAGGEIYITDEDGLCWRMYGFIADAVSLDQAQTKEEFYASGEAFGSFQRQLKDFDAALLTETIPDFHNTIKRYEAFCAAADAAEQPLKRAAAREIDFIFSRFEKIVSIQSQSDSLPLRVTHNDTKLNNVMLDSATRRPLCVIDLDTVMPGTVIHDFGDSIRFGASTAAEDETNLDKVTLDLSLFEAYSRGFLKGCAGTLTPEEKVLLPEGALIMTLECGIRFLTDYLQNDVYFKIHRPGHNWDRCRTQLKLAAEMENNMDAMRGILAQIE